MSLDTFTRAYEDIPRTVTLTSDGTTALDTSNFSEITVVVKHRKWKTTIGTYTLTGGTVTKESPTSGGQVTIIIDKADTEDKPTGVYQYEVYTVETDADYPSNTRNRAIVDDCFYLESEL